VGSNPTPSAVIVISVTGRRWVASGAIHVLSYRCMPCCGQQPMALTERSHSWPSARHWKCRRRVTASWVRIPPSPPFYRPGSESEALVKLCATSLSFAHGIWHLRPSIDQVGGRTKNIRASAPCALMPFDPDSGFWVASSQPCRTLNVSWNTDDGTLNTSRPVSAFGVSTRQPRGQGPNDLFVRFYRMAKRRIVEKAGQGHRLLQLQRLVARRSLLPGDA
jgi:hypothetical protein